MKKLTSLLVILCLVFAMTSVSFAAGYPESTITLLCPWGAGGSTDICARSIADVATEKLGVPVIVENREGGGSSIGTQEVANIKDSDGYTILVATINGIAVAPHTLDLDYSASDFKGVGRVCNRDLALIAAADKGWSDFNEFVEAAKEHPGEYYIAISAGSLQHITFQKICDDAGIEVNVYPVAGDSEQITAVLSGTADLCLPGTWGLAQGQLEAGEMIALGVFSPERIEELPDTKTFIEQGFDTQVSAWTALLLPASTPDEIVAAAQDAFKDVIESDELAELLLKNGQAVAYLSGEETMKIIQEQYDSFGVTIADMEL